MITVLEVALATSVCLFWASLIFSLSSGLTFELCIGFSVETADRWLSIGCLLGV